MNEREFYLMTTEALTLLIDKHVPQKSKGRDAWMKKAKYILEGANARALMRQFER